MKKKLILCHQLITIYLNEAQTVSDNLSEINRIAPQINTTMMKFNCKKMNIYKLTFESRASFIKFNKNFLAKIYGQTNN